MLDKAALLREMERNNCSVDELARVCGISRSAIYRRLRGEIDFKVGEIIIIKHTITNLFFIFKA